MHGVRATLLQQQAESADLPLYIIEIPSPCSNEEYAAVMTSFVAQAKDDRIECFAFGDLYLEDIRHYRETRLEGTGITPIFPLWGIPTTQLSEKMIDGGLRAMITCLDPKRLPRELSGREYNRSFLADLPDGVGPCGENGEFHSFAFDGPMFDRPIALSLGETVERDGFVFTDFLSATPD